MMKTSSLLFKYLAFASVTTCWIITAWAGDVDWRINKTLKLADTPIDVAVSSNGKQTFVLTDAGQIIIYDAVGNPSGTIDIGGYIDKIMPGPNENSLLVFSKQRKVAQVVSFVIKMQIDTDGSPFRGNPEAPVEMILFSDFQCPYCARIAPILDDIVAFNGDDIKLVFKNFPLNSHKLAFAAAKAAMAANDTGKFWQFHDQLQSQYNTMTEQSILEIAQSIGFELDAFQSKMADQALANMILQDMQDGVKAGVKGVPALFINGKLNNGRTFDAIQLSIEQELRKKRDAGDKK